MQQEVNVSRVKQALCAAGMLGAMALGAAQATTINAGLVPGVPNLVIDESREAYVDAGSPGVFGVGDVIFGYIRISDFQPSGLTGGNSVYGIFSQEVIAVGGPLGITVTFGPTTVAGLTLSALTGAATPVGSIVALYDTAAFSVDLINASPGGATKMKDYLDLITAEGTLRLIAGFSDVDDFLLSTTALIGAPTSSLIGVPSGITIASTAGALSVLFNATIFTYDDTVPASGPPPLFGPFALAEIGVSSGTVAGTSPALPSPQTWLVADYPGFSFTQCTSVLGADTPCGFIDKNNFNVNPQLPEPSTHLLLGLALLALAGFRLRRKQ